jgi:hypothetical protein
MKRDEAGVAGGLQHEPLGDRHRVHAVLGLDDRAALHHYPDGVHDAGAYVACRSFLRSRRGGARWTSPSARSRWSGSARRTSRR